MWIPYATGVGFVSQILFEVEHPGEKSPFLWTRLLGNEIRRLGWEDRRDAFQALHYGLNNGQNLEFILEIDRQTRSGENKEKIG